jgi:hypothetical protein
MSSILYMVYETTNLVNGRKYRGAHKGKVDDDYIGSGKILHYAIQKYGKENFKREVLFCAFDIDSMYWAEQQLVTSEWIEENNAYNLKEGGLKGGFTRTINGQPVNYNYIPEIKEKIDKHKTKEYMKEFASKGQAGIRNLCEQFGVENLMQVKQINEKAMKTRKINWSVKYNGHAMNDALVKQKSIDHRNNTLQEKYSVNCIAHIPGVAEKRSATMSETKWLHHVDLKKNIRKNKNLVPEYLEQGWLLGKAKF